MGDVNEGVDNNQKQAHACRCGKALGPFRRSDLKGHEHQLEQRGTTMRGKRKRAGKPGRKFKRTAMPNMMNMPSKRLQRGGIIL